MTGANVPGECSNTGRTASPGESVGSSCWGHAGLWKPHMHCLDMPAPAGKPAHTGMGNVHHRASAQWGHNSLE